MSNYLRDRAKPGDRIALRCSKGSFYLRPVRATGDPGRRRHRSVGDPGDGRRAWTPDSRAPGLPALRGDLGRGPVQARRTRRRCGAACPAWSCTSSSRVRTPSGMGRTGLVTDLLDERMLAGGDADVYLCGPGAMVEATRTWLDNNGFHRVGLYYEKFVPSGAARRRNPARLDYAGYRSRRGAPPRSRHRGGHRRQHRGHRRGQGAQRNLRARHRAREGRSASPPRGQAGRGAGLAPASPAHRGTDRAGAPLPRASSTTWCARARSRSTWPPSTESGWAAPGRSPVPATSRSSAPGVRCSNGACGAGSTTNRGSTSATSPRSPTWSSTATPTPSSASPSSVAMA